MKTKEELTAPEAEAETLTRKPTELTDDELADVTGGVARVIDPTSAAPSGRRPSLDSASSTVQL